MNIQNNVNFNNSGSANVDPQQMFAKFEDFSKQNGSRVRVQLTAGGQLIVANREASAIARAFQTKHSRLAREANNEVRTALLKAVLVTCGCSSFEELPPSIKVHFSGSKEFFTGEGSDMALNERGEATSGRPLSVRRISAIVKATKEYVASRDGTAYVNWGTDFPYQKVDTAKAVLQNVAQKWEELRNENQKLPAFAMDETLMGGCKTIKSCFSTLIGKLLTLSQSSTEQIGDGANVELRECFRSFRRDIMKLIYPMEEDLDLAKFGECMPQVKQMVAFVLEEVRKDINHLCVDETFKQLIEDFDKVAL